MPPGGAAGPDQALRVGGGTYLTDPPQGRLPHRPPFRVVVLTISAPAEGVLRRLSHKFSVPLMNPDQGESLTPSGCCSHPIDQTAAAAAAWGGGGGEPLKPPHQQLGLITPLVRCPLPAVSPFTSAVAPMTSSASSSRLHQSWRCSSSSSPHRRGRFLTQLWP